jgi:N-methylhydantoinase A/oxoprolinase/acetone carboxylase beta subunit
VTNPTGIEARCSEERSGIAPERIDRVIHATTLFTNALIRHKGAPTELITMAGFCGYAGDWPRPKIRVVRPVP